MASPHHILQQVFGYKQFRHQQQAIVEHVIAGHDALVLMPTGGGKSLCYQIPALARDGLAIVVSPLIALMQNQVEALQQLGVNAAFLNSSLSAEDNSRITRQVLAGERGSIPYSAVTQPCPLPFKNPGTFSSTLAVHITWVSPNLINTEPSACLV